MKTAEFKTFLDLFPDYIPYFKTFPKPQCLANCQLYEDQYSNLDEAFENDKGVPLLASLPDSTFEENQMKQSVSLYMEFRDYQILAAKRELNKSKQV
ncbi:MAG: hypothetical protein WCJ61_01680 [Paludibacter sp.]